MNSLPPLDESRCIHLEQVSSFLREKIKQQGGVIPFSEWMRLALYEPNLGYYTVPTYKIGGTHADFITAPEMTPLFGYALANQVLEVLEQSNSRSILEFGAGTGALAESILDYFEGLGISVHYQILDVSDDLRRRQQDRLARFKDIEWLSTLPETFSGCILANEVIDAIPVELISMEQGRVYERGVGVDDNGSFVWVNQPASEALTNIVKDRMAISEETYITELNLQGESWVASIGQMLVSGAAIFIDYGFPRHEFYHQQREEGTLMCHFQHLTHGDPLVLPGLQDITAHVDFTAMADAALASGMDVLGYTSQANFLFNVGLLDLLQPSKEPSRETLSACQKLVSEAEMGELFKVLMVGKQMREPMLGFVRGDRRHGLGD